MRAHLVLVSRRLVSDRAASRDGILNKEQAILILTVRCRSFAQPYNDLVNRLPDRPLSYANGGPRRRNYQIEIDFVCGTVVRCSRRDVLVTASIDDLRRDGESVQSADHSIFHHQARRRIVRRRMRPQRHRVDDVKRCDISSLQRGPQWTVRRLSANSKFDKWRPKNEPSTCQRSLWPLRGVLDRKIGVTPMPQIAGGV